MYLAYFLIFTHTANILAIISTALFNHSHIVKPFKEIIFWDTRHATPSSNLYNSGTRRAGFGRIEMDSGKKAIMREHGPVWIIKTN